MAPSYPDGKEPVIHEYLSNLNNHLEDISKELQILYYNKTTKKIWEIFIELQLEETKLENERVTFKHDNPAIKNERTVVVSKQIIDIKKLIKNKTKD